MRARRMRMRRWLMSEGVGQVSEWVLFCVLGLFEYESQRLSPVVLGRLSVLQKRKLGWLRM